MINRQHIARVTELKISNKHVGVVEDLMLLYLIGHTIGTPVLWPFTSLGVGSCCYPFVVLLLVTCHISNSERCADLIYFVSLLFRCSVIADSHRSRRHMLLYSVCIVIGHKFRFSPGSHLGTSRGPGMPSRSARFCRSDSCGI